MVTDTLGSYKRSKILCDLQASQFPYRESEEGDSAVSYAHGLRHSLRASRCRPAS